MKTRGRGSKSRGGCKYAKFSILIKINTVSSNSLTHVYYLKVVMLTIRSLKKQKLIKTHLSDEEEGA